MSSIEVINYSLISAVRTEDLERTRDLINRYGLSYSAGWGNGYVLLREAVEHNYTAVAKLLLESGSNVNSKSSSINPSDTPLHFAVSNANLEIARLLLDKGANINARNREGRTPLHNVINVKKMEIVELLLKRGAHVNAADKNNETPLHNAVKQGCLQTVELLLNYGANSNVVQNNTRWRNGYSPLHLAAEYNLKEIISLLLSKGAKVDVKTANNTTPLHIAAQKGYTDITEDLLNHGACLHSKTDEGYMPIHYASQGGNEEIVKLLLNRHADVNALTNSNLSPLHIACKANNTTVINILLQNGAIVDNQDKDGRTVLNVAVEEGKLMIVEGILKYCPDIHNQSNRDSLKIAVLSGGEHCKMIVDKLLSYGFTLSPEDANDSKLLHISVEKGYLKIVEDLLKNGADVNTLSNSPSKEGFTLLHSAAKNKQEEIAKLLIVNGADVNAQDKVGKTPILYAIENLDLKTTNLLLINKADVKSNTLLNIAVKKGSIEITEALLEHGADINATDEYGRTALHYTALFEEDHYLYSMFFSNEKLIDIIDNKGEVAKLLLRKGADVNAQTKTGVTTLKAAVFNGFTKVVEALMEYNPNTNIVNENNVTLLHVSADKGFLEICKILLDKGVNVDSKSKNGCTALLSAILNGHSEVVKVLLENSAEVNYKIKNDTTPLHVAAEKGHTKIVEDLLKFGADVNSRVKDGRTALHIASSKGHEQVVKTLLRFGSDINIMCKKNGTPLDYALNGLRSQRNKLHYYDSDDDFNDYRFDEGEIRCERIVDYLQKHILKMKNLNLYLREEYIFDLLRDYVYQGKCKQEIIILKKAKLADSNITFYDILTKSTSSLAVYLRNENLVQALKSDNYKREFIFPIYADIIEGNYRQAIKKQGLIEKLDKNCDLFNNCIKLPYNCIENILSYLSNEDLRLLLEAYKFQK